MCAANVNSSANPESSICDGLILYSLPALNIKYPLKPAPVLVLRNGCILNVDVIAFQLRTLALAVLLSWTALLITISSGKKLPNTFSRVRSTKSGIVTTQPGKSAGLYPDPLFDSDTFDNPPEIVAIAVAPEPDLVDPLNFGKDW